MLILKYISFCLNSGCFCGICIPVQVIMFMLNINIFTDNLKIQPYYEYTKKLIDTCNIYNFILDIININN